MKTVGHFYDSVNSIWKENGTLDYHVGFYENEDDTIIVAQNRIIDKVINVLEIKENNILLDIGCGSGNAAYLIATQTGSNVIGINVSDSQLLDCMELKKRLTNKLAFYKIDASKMDFPNSFFDGVYAIESIMHMERKEVLKRIYKSLKCEKKFIFTDWYVKKPLSQQECDLIWKLVKGYYISIEEYHKLLVNSGFTDIEVEDWSENILPTYREWAPEEELIINNSEIADDINSLIDIAINKLGYCRISARKKRNDE